MKQEYVDCFDLFDYAENAVVLTGAGISTLSGIPDYRGKGGLDSKKEFFEGFARSEITDIKFFTKHPDIFYRYAKKYIYPMLDKDPSVGHITLAALQKRGIIDKLYTQNIDILHTKAGSTTYELHGSLKGHTCMKCGSYVFTTSEIRFCIEYGGIPYCSCGGLIKPDVIFFGEELNEELLSQAFNDFMSADIILVIGSSLTVPPVSTLPMAVSLNHAKLIIVNEQPTQYDQYATHKFNDIAEFCVEAQEYFYLAQLNI